MSNPTNQLSIFNFQLSIKYMKAMSKSELADKAGITVTTLMNWCKPYQKELEAMGVKTKDRVLNPKAVRFIVEKFCIDIED
jgi:hypothetical protein